MYHIIYSRFELAWWRFFTDKLWAQNLGTFVVDVAYEHVLRCSCFTEYWSSDAKPGFSPVLTLKFRAHMLMFGIVLATLDCTATVEEKKKENRLPESQHAPDFTRCRLKSPVSSRASLPFHLRRCLFSRQKTFYRLSASTHRREQRPSFIP
jgi:hypothetical protein